MKVFVAGSYNAIADARAVESELKFMGHEVTSSWLHEPFDHFEDDWTRRAVAEIDRADLERSDAVVILTNVPSTSGGYHVELGMALALRKPVYLLGATPGNIYYLLPDVKPYHEYFDPGRVVGHLIMGDYDQEYQRWMAEAMDENYGPA